jgi:hypothetical protein
MRFQGLIRPVKTVEISYKSKRDDYAGRLFYFYIIRRWYFFTPKYLCVELIILNRVNSSKKII